MPACPDAKVSDATSLQEATGAFKEMARRAVQERKKREEERKKPYPADWPMPQDVLKQYLLTQASSIRIKCFLMPVSSKDTSRASQTHADVPSLLLWQCGVSTAGAVRRAARSCMLGSWTST